MKRTVTTVFEEETGRMTGNTTRQVDFAIQQLFNGKIVVVKDHFEGAKKRNHEMLFDRIVNRLKFEHRLDLMLKSNLIRIDKKYLELELRAT